MKNLWGGNIKNACRDLRPVGTRTEGTLDGKHWVVRKRLKEESITKIKERERL